MHPECVEKGCTAAKSCDDHCVRADVPDLTPEEATNVCIVIDGGDGDWRDWEPWDVCSVRRARAKLGQFAGLAASDPEESGASLRETVEAWLRASPEWREHLEHAGTYGQWEDLHALAPDDQRTVPTDLAACRQIVREPSSSTSGKEEGDG